MTIISKIKKWFGSSSKGNEVNAPGIKLFIPKEDLRSFYPESEFVVTADEEMISCQRPNGTEESIRWDDLKAVIIETNDQGPKYPDVFFLLIGESTGCIVPQGAKGDGEFLNQLQRLPNFDNKQVIAAMSSCEDAHFLCWNSDKPE